jgi:hypothetical protein
VDLVNSLIDTVSNKMNTQMGIYLPKVKGQLDQFRMFMENTELKLRALGQIEQPKPEATIDPTEI